MGNHRPPRAGAAKTVGIDVTLEELHQLYQRIEKKELAPHDWPLLDAFVSRLIAKTEARIARMIEKIKANAAAEQNAVPTDSEGQADDEAPERNDSPPHDDDAACSDGSASRQDSAEEPSSAPPLDQESKDKGERKTEPPPKDGPKGHGRNGHRAFTNATHFYYSLPQGIIGALCENCGVWPIYRYRQKVTVRIIGQPLFKAEAHHYEQGRCIICGHIIRAKGPEHVLEGLGTSYITYDWSACGMLIVMHYFGGGPFKRLESLHSGWGIPFSDANQWKVVNESAKLLLPLSKALERHGIEHALNLKIDDTGSMVIELKRQIKQEIAVLEGLGQSTKNVRTGINATGIHIDTKEGTIILYYTGRHHAGEMLDRLLKYRQNLEEKLVKVSDGATKNFSHQHADILIEGTCNAHAFLKFHAIKHQYPAEYAIAAEVYHQVFENDDKAKAQGLTAKERMDYHRVHSQPLMEKLKAMCEEKITSGYVEPNSKLWEPLRFIINQWTRLTQFYREPGVPLDTNLVEQTLIVVTRYLAGSFNYQTVNGAEVGDQHMSLIASARANGLEPVSYLTDCLRHHEDLAKRPEYYLPWVYRERHRKQEKCSDAERYVNREGRPTAPTKSAQDIEFENQSAA
jgi:hypothetical protein